jgi:hypothetical protein
MNIDDSPFSKILKSQIKNKSILIKRETPPDNGISLTILNNTVKHSKCNGTGFQLRKKQIIQLFQDVTKKYQLKNCYININLDKIPKDNYFNFYKEKHNDNQFLLPNPRFNYDNVLITSNEKKYNNYDQVKNKINTIDISFNEKKDLLYINCNVSQYKLKLFKKLSHINKKKKIIDAYMCIGDSHKKNIVYTIDPSLNKIKYFVKKKMAGFEYKYFEEHCQYKYLLIDPYYISNDKIRLLLNLNAVTFMKASEYENFYSHTLIKNKNYIEFESYTDLKTIYNTTIKDQELCSFIIQNNKQYCQDILTYDNILEYIALLINNIWS